MINAWLYEHDERKQQLTQIDMRFAGGTKSFCTDVWAAAFNHQPSGLGEFIKSLRWSPHQAVVYCSESHGFVIGQAWSDWD